MISIKALGMYSSDFSGGETRNGDTQIATDGKYFDVIDGGCDKYATRLITHLKSINIRDPYLHISHCHYDHRDGIEKILSDPWFTPRGLHCQDPDSITAHNSEIRSDINALRNIIAKAKKKNIPVIFLDNEDKIEHGEIKITVYRQYPKYTGNSDAYLNDGSLSYWFTEQRYLTTGDASMWCAYKYNLNPLIVKGGHHGNDMSADGYLKPSQMCVWLYKRGCRFYWDNDFSARLTDFLMTGREDAINAGMTFIDIHGDIDMIFAEGKVTISHGGKTYTAAVPYQGKALKASWEKGSKGMWYRYPDGTWATGWAFLKTQDGKGEAWHYFDTDGWLQYGWIKDNGYWYFLDDKDGHMHTGWLNRYGLFYLEPVSGKNQGHAYMSETAVIDGKTYRFDDLCYAKEVSGSSPIPSGRPDIKQNPNFKGYNTSARNDPIMYIVIHYTGAEGTAKNNVDYFNGGNRNASADFFVGQNGEIWQYNPNLEKRYSWHCGGGRQSSKGGAFFGMCKNANSIGIELCTHKQNGEWIFYDATIEAARRLVQYLMQTYNIKQKNVIRHYDVNGKNCPAVYGYAGDNAPKWTKFKASLSESTHYDDKPQIYRVRKSWKEADTQKGAFSVLENAKKCAQTWGSDYHVFDNSGIMVM